MTSKPIITPIVTQTDLVWIDNNEDPELSLTRDDAKGPGIRIKILSHGHVVSQSVLVGPDQIEAFIDRAMAVYREVSHAGRNRKSTITPE